jgi:hypothetical protein
VTRFQNLGSYCNLATYDHKGASPPRALFRLPFEGMLIGIPHLPVLRGGVIAGFAKAVSALHLICTLPAPKVA